jgi:hypothetical protein
VAGGRARPLGATARWHVLPFVLDDVAVGPGSRAGAYLGWALLPALEPSRAVPPLYHLPLGPTGGSDTVARDWSISIEI